MGTRHLICVVKDNKYKVAQYGQFDGYPKETGVSIVKFLRNDFDREVFEGKLNQVSFLTDEETQSSPENDRYTSSRVLSIIQNTEKPLFLEDALNFAGESLFCEWAYVIDLDKNSFEVYKGFNKKPLSKDERFYSVPSTEEFYPVKFVKSFALDTLPNEETFVKEIESLVA